MYDNKPRGICPGYPYWVHYPVHRLSRSLPVELPVHKLDLLPMYASLMSSSTRTQSYSNNVFMGGGGDTWHSYEKLYAPS